MRNVGVLDKLLEMIQKARYYDEVSKVWWCSACYRPRS